MPRDAYLLQWEGYLPCMQPVCVQFPVPHAVPSTDLWSMNTVPEISTEQNWLCLPCPKERNIYISYESWSQWFKKILLNHCAFFTKFFIVGFSDIQYFRNNLTTSVNFHVPIFPDSNPSYHICPAPQPASITGPFCNLFLNDWILCFYCCLLWIRYLVLYVLNITNAPDAPWPLFPIFHIHVSTPSFIFLYFPHYILGPRGFSTNLI